MKRFVGLLVIALTFFAFLGSTGAAPKVRWKLLGQQTVDFRKDRDAIHLGNRAGRFRALMFKVDGASIEMRNMVVTFGDGSQFRPEIRHRFREGASSRVIDLPGDRRYISQIDFVYRSLGRHGGRATLSLYGHQSHRDD
jgi:hypothetical protein